MISKIVSLLDFKSPFVEAKTIEELYSILFSDLLLLLRESSHFERHRNLFKLAKKDLSYVMIE